MKFSKFTTSVPFSSSFLQIATSPKFSLSIRFIFSDNKKYKVTNSDWTSYNYLIFLNLTYGCHQMNFAITKTKNKKLRIKNIKLSRRKSGKIQSYPLCQYNCRFIQPTFCCLLKYSNFLSEIEGRDTQAQIIRHHITRIWMIWVVTPEWSFPSWYKL